ncbi:hypothetical protein ES703_70224 [subsurface metagenome]
MRKKEDPGMKDRSLPGLDLFLKDPDEEKEIKEEGIFFEDLIRVWACGEISRRAFKRMSQKKRDLLALKCAGEFNLQLPLSIKRRLRSWKGPDSYKELKKAPGYKSPIAAAERIHAQFPLSLRGFKKHVGPEITSFKRTIGNKTVAIWIASGLMVPAGDLPKRLFHGIAMFAAQRKTMDPGPIKFQELLDRINELPCPQHQRRRVYEICSAMAKSMISVTVSNKKGEEIGFDHAPFFKRFIWEGGLDLSARIFPIFNEEIPSFLIDEGLGRYIWIEAKRLRKLPGMTARDRLAQDQFKMLMGIPSIKFKMRTWLQKFGQFTETRLKTKSLSYLRGFVNKNFERAERDFLIVNYEIRGLHKKESYLDQVIWFQPAKLRPRKERIELTNEELEELEEITTWLYEAGREDGSELYYETIEDYLKNAAEAGLLDCIKDAYVKVEDSGPGRDYPVGENDLYENRPMYFWAVFRNCKEIKIKDEKRRDKRNASKKLAIIP